ncbi:hypothetical protein L2E82_24595 [Cichorium intybus]|uniref:Uncharacterized protein n=1 Tax=Cichorium intybus TaxID=13427 RepID=A0ACB9E2A0_CICIN|nr:hypothetical protein L2E82_24595 [Cichorium intybus]
MNSTSMIRINSKVAAICTSLASPTINSDTYDVLQFRILLMVIAISALFFLFSVLGILTNLKNSFQFPSSILNILCLFGFVEEFFLFYIQKKDPDGIDNRYYDLLLVPICICIVSTLLELRTPKSNYSRLGRGVGLVLQGMWFVQIGLSFYSSSITNGCFMREKSRGNFTIRCKGHPEFHREPLLHCNSTVILHFLFVSLLEFIVYLAENMVLAMNQCNISHLEPKCCIWIMLNLLWIVKMMKMIMLKIREKCWSRRILL